MKTDLVANGNGVEACVYGVYAIDHGEDHGGKSHKDWRCTKDSTHDRPEIHPFDATWWRIPAKYGKDGFVMGVFQDDSNRYSFPHCSDDHNDSAWSQAPRDVTFKFPFRFQTGAAAKRACIRHVRAPKYGSSSTAEAALVPLNVTTAAMPSPTAEKTTLNGPNGRPVLIVDEPAGFESETQVSVDGCVQGNTASGFVTVRVAVGCNEKDRLPNHPKMACADADFVRYDKNGRHTTSDPGSGFYYAEIYFADACQ